MTPAPKLSPPQMIRQIFANHCPVCLRGRVFRGFYSMNRQCPDCGYVFEREQGYFMGALVAAYFVGAFSMVPTVVICLLIAKVSFGITMTLVAAQALVLNPFLFRYSRLIWMHVETQITRDLETR